MLWHLTFNLYHQFVVEERFGFNTMTWRLWLSDQIKGLLVSALLFGLLLSGALWLVQAAPHSWWLWVWGFFALFSLFLMYISPYLIEPLFFKFEPLGQPELEERITRIMEKAGLKVSRVFQVDASRRSRHSNAYFTGIGRVKRIVLFDTLLEQLTADEIVAVLAHEVGHWKKRHVFKRLVTVQLLSLGFLVASWWLINSGVLPGLIGLEEGSFFAQVMILSLLASLAGFVVSPIWSALSRRDEYQADHFACDLTADAEALASALVKLSRDNPAILIMTFCTAYGVRRRVADRAECAWARHRGADDSGPVDHDQLSSRHPASWRPGNNDRCSAGYRPGFQPARGAGRTVAPSLE